MFKIKSMLTENSCHCPFKGLVTLDTALQWRCSWGEIGENDLCLISREKSEKVDFAVEKHNLPGRELTGILWELSHTGFGEFELFSRILPCCIFFFLWRRDNIKNIAVYKEMLCHKLLSVNILGLWKLWML